MTSLWYGRAAALFEFLFLAFLVSFFLLLATDFPAPLQIRMFFGAAVAVLYFLCRFPRSAHPGTGGPTVFFFGLFLLFEIVRCVWGVWLSHTGTASGQEAILAQWISAPTKWSFELMFLCLGLLYFNKKQSSSRLSMVLMFSAFFIAVNAIPPLLSSSGKHALFLTSNGDRVFFFPIFYFHKAVAQYILAQAGHVNQVGDVMALGFFPGLGLAYYRYQLLSDQIKRLGAGEAVDREAVKKESVFLLMALVVVATIAIAIILQFSRGTMLCFAAVLVLYLAILLIRFFSPGQAVFFGAIVVVLIGFLVWGGRLNKAVEEAMTLQREVELKGEGGSLSLNAEGIHRATAIFMAHPVWGVGSGGYRRVSKLYATPGVDTLRGGLVLANTQSMNHYLHLLAEEGLGAIFYFLFLIAYAIEILTGLIKTKSRFKFVAALSFVAPVVVILSHAIINHLMERFSVAMPVFIVMGASLAVLRKDFGHQE